MMMQAEQSIETADSRELAEQTSPAWLLSITGGLTVAVAEQDVIYVFPEVPEVFPIPQTPAHVSGVLTWQQQLVPVIDLGVYQAAEQVDSASVRIKVTVLLALADSKLAAMELEQIPERAEVADSSQCELPASLHVWDRLASSCFMHKTHGAVPILDLNLAFGGRLSREILNRHVDYREKESAT